MATSNSILAASLFLKAALTSRQTSFVEALLYKSFFSLVPEITVDEATEATAFLLRRGFLEKRGLTYALTERSLDLMPDEAEAT